ncbi:MAG: Maf family nucleotide pyrophosphatase [Psychroflexus sp.]|uniref:Maf family nucleotide pyrophosphatase n=1 Tax=Psychroflexus sp. S27 TaxID=1982757 RepID=UPI000C29961F|nr:Maf family nucleotide pyrophosphatase [Psychroflexus sp. S27]PJX25194.1 septum formation protein Maf [Psychroflexus sp. S27]
MSTVIQKMNQFKIILGSASPRRQSILKELGLDFSVKIMPVDEIYPDHLKREEIAIFLAELKAKTFEVNQNEIIITGDTVVWHNNKALGKPKNSTEAKEMLQSLSGKSHEVISSVCLKTSDQLISTYGVTKVFFKDLSKSEIEYYVNNFKPYDKAGAYGVQEWIGQIGVTKIEGSFYNVMGLPTLKIYEAFEKLLKSTD